MGAQIVPSTKRGAYCFRIHGQIYHRTSHPHPAEAGGNDALFEIARATPGHTARLSDMAQRGQERRAEETEEQRNRRLAVKGRRSQHIRAEETEEQRKDNTFWEERNVYVSDNICKKK
ncbi:hypothetical protein AVEN_11308-1 [Araneus ventricosus]|uniref:STPR domain-containing protein n=1 Tax=Araneus ventricosus TaxID=182803 RepID=A0A4Y2E1I3_ARAVE|nr:hypothetical protein AVEN_11308-1 [Araneus ventricosus]